MVDRGRKRVSHTARRLREDNERAVLHAVWSRGPSTASDIIGRTSLARNTVHELCDRLIDAGWLEELPPLTRVGGPGAGRPPRRYALAERAGVVVGVEASASEVRAVVADLNGQPLSRLSAPTGGTLHGPTRVALVRSVVDAAIGSAGHEVEDVLCLAVGVPAPVAADGRTTARGNPFWDAMNPDLVTALARPGWTVVVDNIVNLASVAEAARGAARGVDDHVTLMLDEGIGAGVVLGGRLLHGAHGGAGEMRFLDHVDGVGAPTGVGALAPELARVRLRTGRSSLLRSVPEHELDAVAVLEAAVAGDPLAVEVEVELARRLTRVVEVVATVFDPELVVLAGHVAPACGRLRDAVVRDLPRTLGSPRPRVELATSGADAATTGAVERALAQVRASSGDVVLRRAVR